MFKKELSSNENSSVSVSPNTLILPCIWLQKTKILFPCISYGISLFPTHISNSLLIHESSVKYLKSEHVSFSTTALFQPTIFYHLDSSIGLQTDPPPSFLDSSSFILPIAGRAFFFFQNVIHMLSLYRKSLNVRHALRIKIQLLTEADLLISLRDKS